MILVQFFFVLTIVCVGASLVATWADRKQAAKCEDCGHRIPALSMEQVDVVAGVFGRTGRAMCPRCIDRGGWA